MVGFAQAMGHDGIDGACFWRPMMLDRPGDREAAGTGSREQFTATTIVIGITPDPSEHARSPPQGSHPRATDDPLQHRGDHTACGPEVGFGLSDIVQRRCHRCGRHRRARQGLPLVTNHHGTTHAVRSVGQRLRSIQLDLGRSQQAEKPRLVRWVGGAGPQ